MIKVRTTDSLGVAARQIWQSWTSAASSVVAFRWWQQLRKHPTRLLVGGFATAILVAGVLTLPLSASSTRIGPLDALFTATSAVCVTGLTVCDTGKAFSTFGQAVILLLIQLGGLGITTLSRALFLFFGQRASLSTHDIVEGNFIARPQGKLKSLLVKIFVSPVAIEAAGAARDDQKIGMKERFTNGALRKMLSNIGRIDSGCFWTRLVT